MAKRGAHAREYGITVAELGASGGELVMVALLPVVLEPRVPSVAWIGALMASEGVFAIVVPYLIGALSDRLPPRLARRFGRRTFFLLVTAPILAACLALVPFRDRFWAIAGLVFLFFAALHGFMTPLFALVIEGVSHRRWGRVYGVFGAMRAGGIAYGLVAGGLLFSLWPPLPFLTAAALVLLTTAATYALGAPAERGAGERRDPGRPRPATEREFWRDVARRPAVRWFLIGNAFGTAAIDGLRPYVFLFATAVLGLTIAHASVLLGFLLAGVAAGSLVVGWLGDRFGRRRLLLAGTALTGVALAFGVLVRELAPAILLMIPAGLGAATLATLPYPVFAQSVHAPSLGRYTGVFRVSIGAARLIAPLGAGLAIDWGTRLFPAERGYPLMWPVCALFALVAAAAFRRAGRAEQGRGPPARRPEVTG